MDIKDVLMVRVEEVLSCIPIESWEVVDTGSDALYIDVWQSYHEGAMQAFERAGLEFKKVNPQEHPWTLKVELSPAAKQALGRAPELRRIGREAWQDAEDKFENSNFKFEAVRRAMEKFRNLSQEDLKELEQGWVQADADLYGGPNED